MTGIRALEREDLPGVAALYASVMRVGRPTSLSALSTYLERTLLDHPWADADIPSLVWVDDGEILGFLGSYVRHSCLDGRPIRIASSGQLVVEPSARRRGVGALLMRRHFLGAQELTFTDAATEVVRRIWENLGGETAHLRCIGWTRVFRPVSAANDFFLRRPASLQQVGRAVARPIDAVAAVPLRPRHAGDRSVSLSPQELANRLADVVAPLRFYPAYDGAFLQWLFGELRSVTSEGSFVANVVEDGHRIKGWYWYFLRPHGVSKVLQIAATERAVEDVIDNLFEHAASHDVAALHGRVEPLLLEPLSRRRCILRYTGGALVHSKDDAVIQAATSRDALLTRADGDWWMGHHLVARDSFSRS